MRSVRRSSVVCNVPVVGTAPATIGTELDGDPGLSTVVFDLASVGYTAHEHVVSGTATSYGAAGALGDDGRWDVRESGRAKFVTRLVVHRPRDAARANGTVIVEWLNVTGGLDIAALWMATHRHLIRAGYTWIGVTAQRVGIEGGGVMPGAGLKQTAPDRYGSLSHPGDAFAYDIFTQAAQAGRDMLAAEYGLPVDRVIAAGASQSAMYLTTYVNAIDPVAAVIDGFLLQGRAGSAPPLDAWQLDFQAEASKPGARHARLRGRQQIRADARVPTLVVQSETDVFGSLAYLPARQPDSEHFRLWEVAGASHCDTYFLCAAPFDSGALPVDALASLIGKADSSGMPIEVPMNSGPQMHYVLQRGIDAVRDWVDDGRAPASAERLANDGDDGALARDELGDARGGVRTPWVDVPVAALSGLGQPGFMLELFGTTLPLGAPLSDIYPGGRDEYVERFSAATKDAVSAGFLLPEDAPEIVALGTAAWPD
jgi:hypothetical protein